MALVSVFLEILQRPTIGEVVLELMAFMAPIWIAVVVGVFVGWAWKPKWANLNVELDSTSKKSVIVLPQLLSSIPTLMNSFKLQVPTCTPWISIDNEKSSLPSLPNPDYSLSKLDNEKSSVVDDEDLKHLHKLVEEKDGGPAWIQMMDRSTSNMCYQAWRRDPETGPPQYRSRTVYEDATPEMVRDFFWDDEFRAKWDDMLIHAQTLEECTTTGTMVVQWIRKFPFFCSDREYIIGRRIWESGQTYYCITKGVPCSSVPRRNKPRRVDLYYSSWFIRAAESKRDKGQMTACEVLLFHHEDMGIPWEIAKLGIRQGMWGAVKKIDPGLRAYQNHRGSSGAPLSRSASMAQINSEANFFDSLESSTSNCVDFDSTTDKQKKATSGRGISKILVVGGTIALACTLDRGLLTKALIFGVARRFANMGRRL